MKRTDECFLAMVFPTHYSIVSVLCNFLPILITELLVRLFALQPIWQGGLPVFSLVNQYPINRVCLGWLYIALKYHPLTPFWLFMESWNSLYE
jgi:hypothetical protein